VATSRGSHRVLPSRRRKAWDAGIGQSGPQTVLSATGSLLVTAGVTPTIDGVTLLRIRGMLTMFIGSAAAALDGFSGAFGIGVVRDNAFAAGVSSCPVPLTNAGDSQWVFWEAFSIKSIGSAIDDAAGALALLRIPIDTKAMRKLNTEDTIYGAIQVVEVGTSTLNWHVDTRALLALP